MATKKQTNEPEINVGQALNKTERFLQENGKTLTYVIAALVAVIALGFGYQYLYRVPLKKEALDQMFTAEQHFRADAFDLALNGDGNALGFLQIIDEYGSSAPRSVYFYSGICQLQLGNYKEAIVTLKKYKSDDPILYARSLCNIGDAYASLSQNSEALSYYKRAAAQSDNTFAAQYLMKAAFIEEENGNKDSAIKLYEEIKFKYPQSMEGYEADKYISRLQLQ